MKLPENPIELAELTSSEDMGTLPPSHDRKTPNPVYTDDIQLVARVVPNKQMTMREFADTEPINSIIQSLPASFQTTMLNVYKTACRILHTGPVLFKTSAGLEHALHNTDLLKSSMDFLIPPHEAFEFILSDEVPDDLVLYHPHTGLHRLGYILLMDDTWRDERTDIERKSLRVVFIGHLNEKSTHLHDNAVTYASFPYDGAGVRSIQEWLDNDIEGFKALRFSTLTKEELEYLRRLMAFAAKLILYVNSAQCDVTVEAARHKTLADRIDRLAQGPKAQRKKAERLKADYESLPASAFFDHRLLGSHILIDRAPRTEEPGAGTKRGPLTARVYVRGHFHTYWVGKGRETRKINHVAPYYRGPDAAEVVTRRTYEVR